MAVGSLAVVDVEDPPPEPPDEMVNERVTSVAALYAVVAADEAVTLHVPAVTKVIVYPETVHTDVVVDASVTVPPVASVVGATVSEPSERACVDGWAKVMVWVPLGVTAVDAAELLLVPPEFDAVAVKVYAVPLVRLVTSHEPVRGVPLGLEIVQLSPPGEAVTVKVLAVAPLAAPVTVTEACPSPAVAFGCWGASGADCGAGPEPVGVTLAEAAELPLVPPAFVAVAVKVYAVLFVRPLTVHVPVRGVPDRELAVQVKLPGFEVTVNEVGVLPVPLAVTVTSTAAFSDVPVGA